MDRDEEELSLLNQALGQFSAAAVTLSGYYDRLTAEVSRLNLDGEAGTEAMNRQRTQALAAMGEMAAQIAHQIRNPLGGIELCAALLGREVSGEENLERLVGHILTGVRQVNHLISNYLALARDPRPAKEAVRVEALVAEAVAAAETSFRQKGISARVRTASPPACGETSASSVEPLSRAAWVRADRELLLQVFLNLVLNALEALGQGGRLEIELRVREVWVDVVFRDSGSGIAREDLERVFSPLFTTKEKSLGLGLTVSHRGVAAHGGLLEVESEPGRGTSVTVTLPRLSAVPAGRPGEEQDPGGSGPEVRSER